MASRDTVVRGAPIDAEFARADDAPPARVQHLFISFAIADRELASAFANLLQLGCNLSHEQIRITARPGEIPPGTPFVEAIRSALDTAAMAVLLLTPSYYESRFCLAEAGAIWGSGKDRVPVVVPPIEYADLDGVQLGEQGIRIDSSTGLDVLRDRIRDVFGTSVPTAQWTEHKRDFLNRWTAEFEGRIAEPQRVPAGERDEWKARAEEQTRRNRDLQDEVERLRKYTTELRTQNEHLHGQVPRAPPPPELEGDETRQWLAEAQETIELAAGAASALPPLAQEALFRKLVDGGAVEIGDFGRFNSTDAQDVVDAGFVNWAEDDTRAVELRYEQPDVATAVSAFHAVRERIFSDGWGSRSEAGDWIKGFLRTEYGVTDPVFEIKDTWEKLGFL